MIEVVGVKFKTDGRVYYFDLAGSTLNPGQYVVVETSRGVECGEIVTGNHKVRDDQVVQPLKPVIRKADNKDMDKLSDHEQREKEAFKFCEERIGELKLEMNLVDVDLFFDESKMVFYFTADGRVDFRQLVKDLAAQFHIRIDLRQIGVRDEAKILGGLGVCGREFCCCSFLNGFEPVSIKMAKEQNLSLNSAKISGACGRLMCCLKYEQNAYEDLLKNTPKNGSLVQTPSGTGIVSESNLVSGIVTVKPEDPDAAPLKFHRDELKVLRPPKKKSQKNQDEDNIEPEQ